MAISMPSPLKSSTKRFTPTICISGCTLEWSFVRMRSPPPLFPLPAFLCLCCLLAPPSLIQGRPRPSLSFLLLWCLSCLRQDLSLGWLLSPCCSNRSARTPAALRKAPRPPVLGSKGNSLARAGIGSGTGICKPRKDWGRSCKA